MTDLERWQNEWDVRNIEPLVKNDKVWYRHWNYGRIPAIVREEIHPYYILQFATGEIEDQCHITDITRLEEKEEQEGWPTKY